MVDNGLVWYINGGKGPSFWKDLKPALYCNGLGSWFRVNRSLGLKV